MNRKSSLLVLFVFLLCCSLAGCSAKKQITEEELAEEFDLAGRLPLPATFTGEFPCPDCLRVDLVLNLRPDALYQLRKIYRREQGADQVEAQIGKWRYSPEGDLVILGKEKGSLKTYTIVDEDHLRFVEWEGAASKDQIQYDLQRSLEIDPFDDTVKIRAMYRLDGDKAIVEECAAGNTFPVTEQGASQETAQNYMNTPHPNNRPVLVSFLGRLINSGGQESVVIQRFNRFYPNEDCDGNKIKAGMTGTYWRLLELDGQEITADMRANAPYLLLEPDKTMEGFGGCNKITGSYLVQGEVFLVKRVVQTRVACPEGLETENSLLQALDEAETYRIEDNVLELLDQRNEVRVRFEAGP